MAFFVSIFSAFCFLIDVIIHNYILGIYIYICEWKYFKKKK